jgi:hypothetical protein
VVAAVATVVVNHKKGWRQQANKQERKFLRKAEKHHMAVDVVAEVAAVVVADVNL